MRSVLIWCELNSEQDMLERLLGSKAISIRGSTKDIQKIKLLKKWLNKDIPILISKPKIFGFGLNFQHCHDVIFASISDSFEQFFQAERRVYRYGQKKDVTTHIVTSEAEGSIKENIKRKEIDFLIMINEIVKQTKRQTLKEIKQVKIIKTDYNPKINMIIPNFLKEVKQ